MTVLASPSVPVSWGELLDKVTILEIKLDRIDRAEARANVAREHRLLHAAAADALAVVGIDRLHDRLKRVNQELWDIEDAIREEEVAAAFGARFVELARAVYRTNDLRAAIKREINDLLGSELVEEKSYAASVPSAG